MKLMVFMGDWLDGNKDIIVCNYWGQHVYRETGINSTHSLISVH
jgi:hypothetical protein